MDMLAEFRKYAADCEKRAKVSKDPETKATWKRMAERWILCAKLAEDQDLLSFGQQRLQQFEQRFGFPRSAVVADQLRMAADLTQARERGQHMNFALVEPFLRNRLHHLLAAATQFGQIEFSLRLA